MCSSHYSLVSVSISWHVSFYFLKIFFYSSNLSHMYTMYLGHIVLLLFICFCMYWWFGCMKVYVSHACLVPLESRKQCQSPWFWSFKWLWATMWVCGIGLRSSRRVDSALNFWAISTAPKFPFQKILNTHPNIQVFLLSRLWCWLEDLVIFGIYVVHLFEIHVAPYFSKRDEKWIIMI